jgi:hypothetical protein
MDNWTYSPIWWNCQDFAIRFSYLLTTKASLQLLRNLLISLRRLFDQEILSRRHGTVTMASALCFAGGMTAMCGLGVVCIIFPLANIPVAMIIEPFMGISVFGGGATVLSSVGLGAEQVFAFHRWKKNLRKLDEQFLILRELHNGLSDSI